MAPLRARNERIDHRVGECLDQRAERQGDDQADRDDDHVTSQQEVLESLDHRGCSLLEVRP